MKHDCNDADERIRELEAHLALHCHEEDATVCYYESEPIPDDDAARKEG